MIKLPLSIGVGLGKPVGGSKLDHWLLIFDCYFNTINATLAISKLRYSDMIEMLISEKKALGGKRKAELISVYVKPEVKERLERWAGKEERSVSWIIAKLIEQALAEGKDGAEEKL